MLDGATRDKIVADLIDTYRTRQALPLLTQTYPEIDRREVRSCPATNWCSAAGTA